MNKKHTMQRLFVSIVTAAVLLMFPTAALATDISVTADSTSVKAGDTVTLTVTVSAENIAVANGVFTYDPALLTYISSNGGASDGIINMVSAQKGGASSLTAVIKFAAISAGEAIVNVSMDSVLSYDETTLETAQAGVSIKVAASDAAGTQTGESKPPVNLAQTGVAADNVEGATVPMYIWRSLNSLTLPSGYVDRQVTYKGEYVGGAAIPDSEDIMLLYLSDESGENAGYYIYDEAKNTLFPYITVLSVSANFTVMRPDEAVVVPDGYEETTFVRKEKEVPAWIAKGSDGSVYLVYVRTASGEKGFFLYNVEDESMQRYMEPAGAASAAEPTAQPAQEPTAAPVSAQADEGKIVLDKTLFFAICGAGALLIAAVIVLVILYTSKSTRNKRRAARWEKRNYAAANKDDKKL